MNRRRFILDSARLLGSAGALGTASLTAIRVLGQAPAPRFSATHYASPSGAGSHDGTKGNEWTLAEAYANAVAGNRVEFAPGTYTVRSGPSRTQAMTPAHSGSAEDPIVFFARFPAAYAPAERERHTTWVSDYRDNGLGSVTGHAFNAPGGRHVVWDGISMRQANGAWNSGELGVVSLFGGGELHVKFLRCLFDQLGEGQLEPANNWGAVFIQQAAAIEFADCVFRNIPGSIGDDNAQPIVAYATGKLAVHHCEFLDNNGGGLWLKGVQAGSPFDNRPVRLHHCSHRGFRSIAMGFGAVGQGNTQPGQFCDVFQNVWHAAPDGLGISIWWHDLSGGQAPRNVRMVNNTIVGSVPFGGGEEALHRLRTITDANDIWRDSVFANNVIHQMGSLAAYLNVQYGDRTANAYKKMKIDYNCYATPFRHYAGMGFRKWQTLGQDAHTLVGNPRFRDLKAGDFRLAPDSPIRAGGSNPGRDLMGLLDGGSVPINMGAFITADMSDTIGVRPDPITSTLPLVWSWPYA